MLTFIVSVGVTTAHSSGGDRVARSLHRHLARYTVTPLRSLDEERFRSLTFPVPVGVTTAHSPGGDRVARSFTTPPPRFARSLHTPPSRFAVRISLARSHATPLCFPHFARSLHRHPALLFAFRSCCARRSGSTSTTGILWIESTTLSEAQLLVLVFRCCPCPCFR